MPLLTIITNLGMGGTPLEATSVWTVQSDNADSWSAQADDASIWTNQADNSSSWTEQ